MVGNSFTYYNKLDHMVKHLLEDGATTTEPNKETFYAQRIASGGAQLHQHVDNPQVKMTLAERDWTWVVLQEQSQIPGFYGTSVQDVYNRSIDSAVTLNHWIAGDDITPDNVNDARKEHVHHAAADTILLMTWGMREADPMNPVLFRDFHVMQHRLTHGYEEMQKAVSTESRPVRVAPAGLAFAAIYESSTKPLAQNINDTQQGNNTSATVTFEDLYVSDGKHPSVYGSYLAACTIYATLTGKDPRGLPYKPDNISAEQQMFLQTMAAETALQYNKDNVYNRAYFAHQEILEEEQALPAEDNDKDSSIDQQFSVTDGDKNDHLRRTKVMPGLMRSFATGVSVFVLVLLIRILVVRYHRQFLSSSGIFARQQLKKYEELSVTENDDLDDELDFSERSGNGDEFECTIRVTTGDEEAQGLHDISLEE
jgi:hypothetical protein